MQRDGAGLGEALLAGHDSKSSSGLESWGGFQISTIPAFKYLSPRERKMGIVGSVVNTMNAVIGTGILAFPVAFSKVGYVLGTALLILCTVMCFVSLLALG